MKGYIFRFVSLLGERYTHGHVHEFFKQLKKDPTQLTVLGDGTQKKSYLYVRDAVEAIHHVIQLNTVENARHGVQIYNVGTEEYCNVIQSLSWICAELGADPKLSFTGGSRGWIGDNPFIFLDTSKLRETGWRARLSIREAVLQTIRWLESNEGEYS